MKTFVIAASALLVASSAAHAQKSDAAHAVHIKTTPALEARAHISPDSARAIALAQIEGGTITSGKLEDEKGVLHYSFNVVARGKPGVNKIEVDAMTGRIISSKHHGGPVGVAKRVKQKTSAAQSKADSASKHP